jgi:hypothetical protein
MFSGRGNRRVELGAVCRVVAGPGQEGYWAQGKPTIGPNGLSATCAICQRWRRCGWLSLPLAAMVLNRSATVIKAAAAATAVSYWKTWRSSS